MIYVIKQSVTRQDMVDSIMAQPDEREVDFDQTRINSECGCVMVHYGKAKGFQFYSCGYNFWLASSENGGVFRSAILEGSFNRFIPPGPGMRFTYAQLKEHCKETGWV